MSTPLPRSSPLAGKICNWLAPSLSIRMDNPATAVGSVTTSFVFATVLTSLNVPVNGACPCVCVVLAVIPITVWCRTWFPVNVSVGIVTTPVNVGLLIGARPISPNP